jgi:hypothetical protein
MRTTVDIPDETYRTIKVTAAEQGRTVRELVLDGLERVIRNNRTARRDSESPEVPAVEPGSIEVDRETNDDLIGFP